MNKGKSNKKRRSLLKKFISRIYRFFVPKNFMAEVQRGIEVGKGSKVGEKLGGGLYDVGKALRKKVDPKHKMKVGGRNEK